MKKSMWLVLLCLLAAAGLSGAITEYYSFSSGTGAYAPIAGTIIDGIAEDDALSEAIPIGFTFTHGLESYTQVKVSSNGWVGLGTAATGSNLNNELAAGTSFPYLAPLWDDISLLGSSSQYLTGGTAPNRVFTVQYDNAHWNFGSDSQFNFQVRIFEAGRIEFCYGPSTGLPSFPNASIGINLPPGGAGNYFSITPGTPPTASTTAENTNVSQFPGNGVIYGFDPIAAGPNDLAALSLTGNFTPSAGTPSVYTVTVRNRGTNAQTAYTVQLLSGTTVLASAGGPTLAPGTNTTVNLSWTPATAGPMTIFGKVVLAGDTNPLNDATPALDIVVQAAGTIAVTIGSGTETGLIPVNMWWKNSLFETIYQVDEITATGLITGMSFYNDFISNLPQMPTRIWLGLTAQTGLGAGWIPSGQLIQVFDGLVDYLSGQNVITIPLTTPFYYAGGNLVMMVQRPMDTDYYDFSDVFACQTVGTDRSLTAYSDSDLYDPANPPTGQGELSGQFPKTTFYFVPPGPTPQFGVTPESKNFGTVLLNHSASQLFSIYNAGSGSLTVSSIVVSGSPFFSLQNLPALPVTLTTGQIANFSCVYAPSTAGPHTGTITLTDNLTRTQHPVPLSGNCMDPTIYSSPYVQNFDAVTIPHLPLDWNKLVSQNVFEADVETSAENCHSQPNSLLITNGWDETPNVLGIAPPLAPTLNINAMRVKFWALAQNGGQIEVGVIGDPADIMTYSVVLNVPLSDDWAEYVVSLAPFAGTGRYIALRHANQSMWQPIFIDDVTIENTPANDLSAYSVAGNPTPTVGSPTNYTVSVFNWGTNAQSAYTVKLYGQGDVELASAAGPAVNSETSAQVALTWTPAAQGPYYIYGKVFLTGDQNPLNDRTPNLNLAVQPQGTTAVTIGSGDQTGYVPVNMYWRNSLFETIYQAADIPAGGMINSIAFYNDFVTNLPQKPTKIWLGATAQDDLSTGWIPSTDLTLVFDGLVDYPSGQNTIIIPLTTPFPYGGTNLVLMANRPMDTTYFHWQDVFQAQYSTINCSREVHSDDTNYDPANPPGESNLGTLYPKTTLFFSPAGPNPVFGVAPLAKNFGTVLMNQTAVQTFTVFNSGGAPLTVNSIVLSGSPMFNLQNVPALPLTLNPGQNAAFLARYQPTAAGSHTATIAITDNLTRARTLHNVPLSGNCVDPTIYTSPYAQNFDAVTPPALPIDWQKLYLPSPVTGFVGTSVSEPHSEPNCVMINNAEDQGASIFLIAPPLAPTLNLPAMRVKFWARGFSMATLEVGVITNVTDPATFQLIQTVGLTEIWAEYVVSFQTYAGTGHHIAFRHGNTGMWQNIYLDDATIENTPANDLAALSLTGNSTPSVGMANGYTANLFNWGTNPQTNYTVKLYKQGGTELASVAGPAINPGLAAQVALTWSPSVLEETYIYAKVILAGDENSLNDQTPNLNVYVQPAGSLVVTIGDGSEQAFMPVNMYYQNSLFECVYPASELNFLGMITGIAFYNDFLTDLPNMPTNVWLGSTALTDLSAGWIPSTSLTSVFSGNVNYPSGQNTVFVSFPQPFLFLEGNLVLMVERPMDTQYYNYEDRFACQTSGTSRSRNIYSDWDDYDPASPPEDGVYVTGQFPKTSLYVIPGGVGHLTGTVLGAGGIPLQNATVQITGGAGVNTNAQGQYTIQNIMAGTYEVTASRYGYLPQTLNAVIPEDSTVTQNFTLTQMPTVTVTGTAVGSDAPTIGLAGATIEITGYENYSATANAQGVFSVPGVYANQTYDYLVGAPGYQNLTGTMNVGATNYNLGTLVLSEIAYTPRNVEAVQAPNQQSVDLTWLAPDPNAVNVNQSFEGTAFPPDGWSQVITNNGPPNTSGVYPTWCRIGTITSGTSTVAPTDGAWQCGFWWAYSHQEEWLITPQFNCPQAAFLTFDTFAYYGSLNNDHYYVKITNNNGLSWDVLWDASTLTGGWNEYQTPVSISLDAYTGQQVKLAWHADDPDATSDGMWYNWFIDNIQVGNTRAAMRSAPSGLRVDTSKFEKPQGSGSAAHPPAIGDRDRLPDENRGVRPDLPLERVEERSLTGYKVWRLVQGQEQNEATWVSLTPSLITALNLTDAGWAAVAAGTYKWAVKAVYTNDVYSLAAFSNPVVKAPFVTGTLAGAVRNTNNLPIMGATVTAGAFTATTAANGNYTMPVAVGTYAVTCSAPGYQGQTTENVVITQSQTTVCNFFLTVPNADEVQVTQTALKGNYPNPFCPETTICYDVKGVTSVRIDICNVKGQLVRTLVDESKATGRHTALWDGRDSGGRAVAGGIYHCRMRAGDYRADRRMLLLK